MQSGEVWKSENAFCFFHFIQPNTTIRQTISLFLFFEQKIYSEASELASCCFNSSTDCSYCVASVSVVSVSVCVHQDSHELKVLKVLKVLPGSSLDKAQRTASSVLSANANWSNYFRKVQQLSLQRLIELQRLHMKRFNLIYLFLN